MKLLSIEFINTKWYSTHLEFKEPLEDDKWIRAFHVRWELPLDLWEEQGYIDKLFELRELLIGMADALCSGKELTQKQLEGLNTYIALSPVYKRIEADSGQYKIRMTPVTKDWRSAVSAIASSFGELLSDFELQRLKQCQNPDCKWLYYDESKSKTKRWCDNTCASLMKVRRFRNKPKASL